MRPGVTQGYTLPMADNCIFCKIVRGEIPSHKVYEDEKTLAFLDIYPVTRGHTLVIPKATDAKNVLDISEDDWLAVAKVTRLVSLAVENAMQADGINLRMNNRVHAGQQVDHPHVHVIPRFKGDGLTNWPPGSYQEGEAALVLEKIRAAL
mgnify:CR=1 FL=1